MIVAQGNEQILESHRREIVVVFCDLRGYTTFTETAEEVLDFLREYHGALGPLVSQYEGTLDQFSGDGIMVFFNDPVPCPDPAERAVKMAMAMREEAGKLIATWRRDGCELGFGAGIAQGAVVPLMGLEDIAPLITTLLGVPFHAPAESPGSSGRTSAERAASPSKALSISVPSLPAIEEASISRSSRLQSPSAGSWAADS